MEEREMELSEALQNLFRVLGRNHTVIDGVVTEVDRDKCTCTVTVSDSQSGVDFTNVPIETLIGSQASVILFPAINSACLLIFRDGDKDRPQLLKVDQVDTIVCNPITLFQFNKGENGGLPITPKLIERLNKIEADLNTVKQAFNSWTPVPDDGGAALKAVTADWAGEELTETMAEDIQSKVVTQ